MDKFEEKVKKMEDLSNKNPGMYKLRLFLFTILGYSYIGLILLILIGAILGIFYIGVTKDITLGMGNLLFILVSIIFLIIKSLLVKIPKPQGIEINKEESPELFHIIEEIRKGTNASKIHKVIMDDEFNASVQQLPVFLVFGNRSYLTIGIPLMMALSKEELKAVLAHEIGHISHYHGKFGNWIYRMRITWYNIREEFQKKDRKGSFIFRWFFNWYVPKYEVYSFILRRQNEYEADRFSVQAVGPNDTASCLINLNIKDRYLDEVFWSNVYKRIVDENEPPHSVYSELNNSFSDKIDDEISKKWLNEALKRQNDIFDTHPTLKQRLESIGIEPFIPSNSESSISLLGKNIQKYIDKINMIWQEDVREEWVERHNMFKEGKERLSELRKKDKLNEEEKWETSYLTEAIEGSEIALPLYIKHVEEYPIFAPVNFALGRILVEKEDISGIDYIKKAMELDKEYIIDGCEVIYDFLVSQGRESEAEKYYEMAYNESLNLEEVEEEKSNLNIDDEYIPHNLDERNIYKLVVQLNKYNIIKEAYLVRKKLKHSQDEPLYVLGVLLDLPWHADEEKYPQAIEMISEEINFEGETLVMYLNLEHRGFRKTFQNIPDSKIYTKQ